MLYGIHLTLLTVIEHENRYFICHSKISSYICSKI